MGGSKDQFRFQFGIERPKEELDTRGIDRFGVQLVVWLKHTGEWCPKEVEIVRFKTAPDTNSLRQVFGELHEKMRKGLTGATGRCNVS